MWLLSCSELVKNSQCVVAWGSHNTLQIARLTLLFATFTIIRHQINFWRVLVSRNVQSTWASGSCLCPLYAFIIGS